VKSKRVVTDYTDYIEEVSIQLISPASEENVRELSMALAYVVSIQLISPASEEWQYHKAVVDVAAAIEFPFN